MGTGLMETLSKIAFSHFSKSLHSSSGYYFSFTLFIFFIIDAVLMDKGVLMITYLGYGDFITAS